MLKLTFVMHVSTLLTVFYFIVYSIPLSVLCPRLPTAPTGKAPVQRETCYGRKL